jgi:hypothetical protein
MASLEADGAAARRRGGAEQLGGYRAVHRGLCVGRTRIASFVIGRVDERSQRGQLRFAHCAKRRGFRHFFGIRLTLTTGHGPVFATYFPLFGTGDAFEQARDVG